MNVFNDVIIQLENIEPFQSWPENTRLIKSRLTAAPLHWQIPFQAAQAAGGTQAQAVPVVATFAALHTSIVLVDDLLDGDGHFEAMGLRQGEIANLAAAFAAAGQTVILQSKLAPETRLLILESLNGMLAATALGQQWDAQPGEQTEAEYWRVARQKSSPFFRAAFTCGGLAGGAPPAAAHLLGRLGALYGEMVQIHDDLKDSLAVPAARDWNAPRPSLPLLFALSVAHPERDAFAQLCAQAQQPDCLAQAQKILLRCGAVSYCLHQLLERHSTALALLKPASLPNPAPLAAVFERIIAPVQNLLERAGGAPAEISPLKA